MPVTRRFGLAGASVVTLRSAGACVVSIASAACGRAQLEGRRSQACRCSRGRRPSESDSELRDRLGVPPQRHPSGVGDPLTRTPLRRACRPQRPSSPLIAHAHPDTPPPEARYHRPPPCMVACTGTARACVTGRGMWTVERPRERKISSRCLSSLSAWSSSCGGRPCSTERRSHAKHLPRVFWPRVFWSRVFWPGASFCL